MNDAMTNRAEVLRTGFSLDAFENRIETACVIRGGKARPLRLLPRGIPRCESCFRRTNASHASGKDAKRLVPEKRELQTRRTGVKRQNHFVAAHSILRDSLVRKSVRPFFEQLIEQNRIVIL
ncbi:MAG: hypothetical protein M3480_07400 [Verrucomicrobiota bacterium]|nr:hypothetical protein [Verrucomicrobiota bacterium]